MISRLSDDLVYAVLAPMLDRRSLQALVCTDTRFYSMLKVLVFEEVVYRTATDKSLKFLRTLADSFPDNLSFGRFGNAKNHPASFVKHLDFALVNEIPDSTLDWSVSELDGHRRHLARVEEIFAQVVHNIIRRRRTELSDASTVMPTPALKTLQFECDGISFDRAFGEIPLPALDALQLEELTLKCDFPEETIAVCQEIFKHMLKQSLQKLSLDFFTLGSNRNHFTTLLCMVPHLSPRITSLEIRFPDEAEPYANMTAAFSSLRFANLKELALCPGSLYDDENNPTAALDLNIRPFLQAHPGIEVFRLFMSYWWHKIQSNVPPPSPPMLMGTPSGALPNLETFEGDVFEFVALFDVYPAPTRPVSTLNITLEYQQQLHSEQEQQLIGGLRTVQRTLGTLYLIDSTEMLYNRRKELNSGNGGVLSCQAFQGIFETCRELHTLRCYTGIPIADFLPLLSQTTPNLRELEVVFDYEGSAAEFFQKPGASSIVAEPDVFIIEQVHTDLLPSHHHLSKVRIHVYGEIPLAPGESPYEWEYEYSFSVTRETAESGATVTKVTVEEVMVTCS